ADPVEPAVRTNDDVVPLVAQVEVEDVLQPHRAISLLCLTPKVSDTAVRTSNREGNRAAAAEPRPVGFDAACLSERPRAVRRLALHARTRAPRRGRPRLLRLRRRP